MLLLVYKFNILLRSLIYILQCTYNKSSQFRNVCVSKKMLVDQYTADINYCVGFCSNICKYG